MENQTNSKSIILNYGLILGVISILPGLIKYAMGGNYLENDWISSVLSLVLTVAFIVLGIKKFKSENEGFLSWGQGVKVGLGIVLISMIISIVYLLLFTNFIEPDFKNKVIESSIVKWEDAGMSSDQIEMSTKMTKDYFELSLYGSIVVMSLFLGFVISAITAAIMKKTEEDTY
ncbi:Protein of unknown function [Polaribacter sp. KT25b]|uniref:DUF4199 domain-containing protein n=1 Tax=Polaribacter sp. KT25b TaxID=1855336 RepID=UPI000879B974|nr:DUF4199 domain-containing protein [Polaribacter sp. KT25b]SDR81574.1 Protein of unknown function [Polaribacter sp. KT25b]